MESVKDPHENKRVADTAVWADGAEDEVMR
jgi:hypothetical protein